MKKTIMIIGGGLLQLPVIKTAQKMGLRVIVTDYNPEALGLKIADIPIVMSTRDIEGSVRIAKKQHEITPISGVLTSGTDASMTVAAVANALGLPGIKFEDAEASTNKIKMRTRFREHSVPSPDFFSVWSLADAKCACSELGLPVVIKPSDNMGARGVRYIDDMNDISDAFRSAKAASPSGELIIEEYMDGDELSIDAVVYHGEVFFTGIADRIIEDLPFFIEKGHTMPSQLDQSIIEEAKRIMVLGIRALGIEDGFAKGDIKITSEGVKIGELAARLSGGFMSTHTFPYATGVDLMKAAIEISLGEEPGNLVPVKNLVSIERAIIPGPGIVDSISGVEEARRIPGVNDIILNVSEGDTVVVPRSNVDKAGHIIATAPSLEEAEAIIRQVRETLQIRISETAYLSMKTIKARARELFGKSCITCSECDGEACASGVPGMGAVGRGRSFIRNGESFSEYRIVTRVLHSVEKPDPSITLFGRLLEFPVLVAPITGTVTNMNGAIDEYDYAHAVVAGAQNTGTIAMVGDGASPEKYRVGLSAIRESGGSGIPVFKPRKELDDILMRIDEARQAGVIAVGIDVDAIGFATMSLKKQSTAPIDGEKLQHILARTELPLILKGIMNPLDARTAVEAGVSGIIVSNHGGRVLDDMLGTLDVLPEIVDAIQGKVPVLADGGIRSGLDVFKALALGATAAMIGRPVCIAAVGMKEKGVSFYLNMIRGEFEKVMGLTGCATVDEIKRSMVTRITGR
ncbi:MAG: alpha-hydroxy-acid oxidizing protein [Spirochaetota bacterium]